MEATDFIESTIDQLKPLFLEYTHAMWDAATSGSEEDNQREKVTQENLMRFWADPELYRTAQELDRRAHTDPIIARQLRMIHLSSAKAQQDESTIERLTELEARVRKAYYNFRAEVDGERLSDNQLDDILRKSRDSETVRKAWQASKLIGEQVADDVRELAKVRNEAARSQGFRDFFEKSLTLDEIVESELLDLLDQLDQSTMDLFEIVKGEIDQRRAEHFGIDVADLAPWHFYNKFFQTAPPMTDYDLDAIYEGRDPVELSLATYDGIGLEVRDILERSDLYAREGKNQHAFCIDLDHSGDIRTLNNLEPNGYWINTLLHELGHAVYDKYIAGDLPWLLRQPPHTLSTEAIAILMGNLLGDPTWLVEILGISENEADQVAQAARIRRRAGQLIFTRWVLVMTNFERHLYADPDQDLNTLWWDLVERHQLVRRPEGRDRPDWASKYHVALAPVYYHNYEIGALLASQLAAALTSQGGGLVGSPQAGTWLRERYFAPGASLRWDEHIEFALGEPLNPEYFIDRLR